jgi:hypothetical protein
VPDEGVEAAGAEVEGVEELLSDLEAESDLELESGLLLGVLPEESEEDLGLALP